MCGVDYSEKALELAKKTCKVNNETDLYSTTCDKIKFKLVDLLDAESIDASLSDSFDCIIDKGTFDAISLIIGTKELLFQQYIKQYLCSVHKLFRKSINDVTIEKFFIIVSCNFTKFVCII